MVDLESVRGLLVDHDRLGVYTPVLQFAKSRTSLFNVAVTSSCTREAANVKINETLERF